MTVTNMAAKKLDTIECSQSFKRNFTETNAPCPIGKKTKFHGVAAELT